MHTARFFHPLDFPGALGFPCLDHPEAPKLMRRAYLRAVDPIEPIEQLKLAWEAGTIEA